MPKHRESERRAPVKERFEDPEVLAVLVVVLAFIACLFTLRPDRELLDRAVAAREKRVEAQEAFLEKRPFLKGLVVALPLDGTAENLAEDLGNPRKGKCEFVGDGRFGKAGRFGSQRYLWYSALEISVQGTWALWLRVRPNEDFANEQRFMTANGYMLVLGKERIYMQFHDNSVRKLTAPITGKGEWMHVAMTWGGDNDEAGVRLYMDGRLVGKTPYSGRPRWQERALGIGASYDPPRLGFDGELDDICVYNRALASIELQQLMEKGIVRLLEESQAGTPPDSPAESSE